MSDHNYQRGDLVYQGRMIVLGVSAAFLMAWILEFLTYPVYLVPGFLLDESLQVFFLFLGMIVQFGIFSICSLLLWAGVGWVRYVFGFYLLLVGLANVVLSITQGALGGPQLVLGAIYLVSASALVMSLGVTRYVEERRHLSVPWLSIGLSIVGLVFVFVGVMVIQLFQVWAVVQSNRQETAFASDILQRFTPSLDMK